LLTSVLIVDKILYSTRVVWQFNGLVRTGHPTRDYKKVHTTLVM